MVAAIQAIGRSQDLSGFAKSWSRDQLALGFLTGALKCEWYGDEGESSHTSDMVTSLAALRERLGASSGGHFPLISLDMLFVDGT